MYWVIHGEERVLQYMVRYGENVYCVLGKVGRRTYIVYWVRYGEEYVLCTGLCMEKNVN